MNKLTANNITVSYNGENVIEDVSINLNEGEIVSLLGVSGSGKTTLFNVLSGLSLPDSGRVLLDGEDVTGETGKMSYMLQKDMLLPHYTVLDNVALPLVLKGEKKKDVRKKAMALFDFFGLSGAENKYPQVQILFHICKYFSCVSTFFLRRCIFFCIFAAELIDYSS